MFLKGSFRFDRLTNNNVSLIDPLFLNDGTDIETENYYDNNILNHILSLCDLKESSKLDEESFSYFVGTKIWDRQVSPRVLSLAESRRNSKIKNNSYL